MRWPRQLRQRGIVFHCFRDMLRLLAQILGNAKMRRTVLTALVFCCIFVIWRCLMWHSRQDGEYRPWLPNSLPRHISQKNTKHFTLAREHEELYMYSAHANRQYPVSGYNNIVVTTMDKARRSYFCCVLMGDLTDVFEAPAQEYFFYHTVQVPVVSKISEIFRPNVYLARQYSCSVPETGQTPSRVTLTSSPGACSTDVRDYIPVTFPPLVPGGLAVCGKIAHSGGLDPEKVIEWFELQRMLGVDKVLLFDMGNPEPLNRIFKYYQAIGILDLQPFELVGQPERTLLEKDKRTYQFHHDETLAVLECRQRMSGYTFVLSHDLDEFIIPRKNIDLKEFFKAQLKKYQDSAGFYFYAEFFIYNWGPSDPDEDMMLTRYQKATYPHWECTKYVYLPSRAISSTTHSIFPMKSFNTYKLPPTEAILHHYRQCPDDVWPTCFPETIRDNIMTRYTDLYDRVLKVRHATNTVPRWNISRPP